MLSDTIPPTKKYTIPPTKIGTKRKKKVRTDCDQAISRIFNFQEIQGIQKH